MTKFIYRTDHIQ